MLHVIAATAWLSVHAFNKRLAIWQLGFIAMPVPL